MTDEPGMGPSERQGDQLPGAADRAAPNHDDAISLIVVGVIALIVGFSVVWSVTHIGNVLAWWHSFDKTVPVEVAVESATPEAPTQEPLACPTAETRPWREIWIAEEHDLVVTYRDAVRPVAADLRDLGRDYRNISDAMRTTSVEAVLQNRAWGNLAGPIGGRLEDAFDRLNKVSFPGSVAGTQVRLTRAVGLLYTCQDSLTEFISVILEATPRYQLGSRPLDCALTITDGSGTDLDKAVDEIEQALVELEDVK